MTGYSIFLVVTGLAIVIISFFISQKLINSENSNKSVDENIGNGNKENDVKVLNKKDIWNKKDEIKLKEDIKNIIKDNTDNELEDVKDKLDKLSNEKIMAVSEFSDQIIEKIEQNHKEVVFLYDMLNNKSEELKKILKQVDDEKKSAELILAVYQKERERESEKEEKRLSKQTPVVKRQVLNKQFNNIKQTEKNMENENNKISSEKNEDMRFNEDIRFNNDIEYSRDMGFNEERIYNDNRDDRKESDNVGENNNKKIIKFYEDGKSVMEIAKMLRLGQGEVKLVIDLFGEVKR